MKKGQFFIKKTAGFSLVEILVSIAIFLVFALVISNVSVDSGRQIKHATNKARAVLLAEEGLEAVRNLRDADFNSLVDGSYGLDTTGSTLALSGASDDTSIFTRITSISPIGSEYKKAQVTVSWADQLSANNSVTLSGYLTNWRSVINTGLTMSKSVINHGGTLLPSDFLPSELNTTKYDFSVEPPVLMNISVPIVFSPSTMNLVSGLYTFATTNHPDYETTLSADCGSGSIVLNNGDAKLCTITYEEYYAPIVTLPTAVSVTQTTATLGATVSSLGLPAVISARGICYDTTPSPLTNCTPEGGLTTGAFTKAFTGLTASTTYYYRGYATNAKGTGYSTDGTFVTLSNVSLPTVTTSAISAITKITASAGGNVTSDGGASVSARGIVWSTLSDPTIALSTKTVDGSGTGSFTSAITGLTCNTTYYVRAYATNSAGTAYGANQTFTTSSCSNISFVGANSAGANTVSIPVHQVGDLLVIFAYRDGNNTAPSLPAGWTNIGNAGGGNNASRLAYRIATATNDPSGTWTNATGLVVHVYRGQKALTPIGSNAEAGNSGTSISYPALTLTQTNGTSWVAGFAGHRNINTALEIPPTGMVNRTDLSNAVNEVAGHDTNGGVSAWTATSVPVGGTGDAWKARTLEILSQ